MADLTLATSAREAMRQHRALRLRRPGERGHQEEAVQQQIALAFLHDQDHTPGRVPACGLGAQLVKPHARLGRPSTVTPEACLRHDAGAS